MKQLLIVDDQPGIRLLLNEVFTKEGFQTFLASNGIEALKIGESEPIDCVLLDMKIPGMDGLEILKRLKASRPELPIIMMTAYGENELLEEAKGLGAMKIFSKPFNIFEVREEVKKILS